MVSAEHDARMLVQQQAGQLEAARLARKATEQKALGAAQLAQASAYVKPAFPVDPSALPPSVSSLRAFEGEDSGFAARKAAQQAEQSTWNEEGRAAGAAAAVAAATSAASAHALLQAQVLAAAQSAAAKESARKAGAVEASHANVVVASARRDADTAAAEERLATHKMVALVVDDGPMAGAIRTEVRIYS